MIMTLNLNFALKAKVDVDLNQGVSHLWSKFGDLDLNRTQDVMPTNSGWHMDAKTDGQTDATTIPEGQYWPQEK